MINLKMRTCARAAVRAPRPLALFCNALVSAAPPGAWPRGRRVQRPELPALRRAAERGAAGLEAARAV